MLRIIKGKDYSKYYNVRKDENGKPYLVDSNKYISISHTDKFTLVITSNTPIGIDVERIRTIDPKLKKLLNISTNNKYLFFKEWTRREAYIKKENLKLKDIINLKTKGRFRTIFLYPYVISICK